MSTPEAAGGTASAPGPTTAAPGTSRRVVTDPGAPGPPGAEAAEVGPVGRAVVDLAVPVLADWVVVVGLDATGAVGSAVGGHADPEHADVVADLVDALVAAGARGLVAAGTTPHPHDLAGLSTRQVAALIGDPGLADHATQLRTRSLLVVPGTATGGPGVVVVLGRDVASPRFGDLDVDAALELARRADALLGGDGRHSAARGTVAHRVPERSGTVSTT